MAILRWTADRQLNRISAELDRERVYRIQDWGALAGHKPFRVDLGLSEIGEADSLDAAKALAAAHAYCAKGQARWFSR